MADTWCCLKSINEAGKNKCLEFGIIINCMLLFGNLKRALFEKVWPIDKNVTEGGDVLQSIFRPSMLSIIINEFMCADIIDPMGLLPYSWGEMFHFFKEE